MSQTCTCLTCGRTEHNQLLVWNKCEQCQRIEYLESEIANYETARQEDARRLGKLQSENLFLSGVVSGIENTENEKLEQVKGERDAMREALQNIATTHRLDPRLAVVAYGYQQIALKALKDAK